MAVAKKKKTKESIATREQAEQRVDEVCFLIARGWTKSRVKRHLQSKYKIGFRQAEEYITRARNNLAAEIGESRESLKAQCYATLADVLNDKSATPGDRIRAVLAMEKLLNLSGASDNAPPAVQVQVANIQQNRSDQRSAVEDKISELTTEQLLEFVS